MLFFDALVVKRKRAEYVCYRYSVWVLPYSMVMLVITVLYARFILSLPASTRRRFIVAGAEFLSGALGLEIVGGLYYEALGSEYDLRRRGISGRPTGDGGDRDLHPCMDVSHMHGIPGNAVAHYRAFSRRSPGRVGNRVIKRDQGGARSMIRIWSLKLLL